MDKKDLAVQIVILILVLSLGIGIGYLLRGEMKRSPIIIEQGIN